MNPATAQEQACARLQAGGSLLITRLRHIGDVILTLPLVQGLRRFFPRAVLHYLAEPRPLEVLQGHPDIDHLWTVKHGSLKTLRLIRRLRQQNFVAAIDLLSNPRSAILVRASGAPLRIGEARRLRRHLYTIQQRPQTGISALEQHLESAQALGVSGIEATPPRIHLRAEERSQGKARLQALADSNPVILMHVGATHPAKEWPHDQIVDCVQRLRSHGYRIVLSTAPNRPEPSQRLAAELAQDVCLLPAIPLRELLGVLNAVDGIIAVDGGIVHVSVALGRPTLALFGPTDPRIWFPYEGFGPFRCLHAGLDCSSCDREQCESRDCMRALAPEDVEDAILNLLATAQPESTSRFS